MGNLCVPFGCFPRCLREMKKTGRKVHPQAKQGWRRLFCKPLKPNLTTVAGTVYAPKDTVSSVTSLLGLSAGKTEQSSNKFLSLHITQVNRLWCQIWELCCKLTKNETSPCPEINLLFLELQSELLLNHRALINDNFKCFSVLLLNVHKLTAEAH